MPDDPAPAAGTEPAPAKTPRSPRFKGFIEGVIASAVVAIAAYFLTPSGNPRLMFKVSPSRSVVVAKSQVGGLRVLHGDREIEGDVTAVQVSLWNEGRGPVRGSGVLEPVKIVTNPPTPIIVASVQKTTRPLTEVSLDTSALASGAVPVNFRILERGDGALVQLVYAGPPTVGIRAVGAVEGQREVETVGEKGAPIRAPVWLKLVTFFIFFALVLVLVIREAVGLYGRAMGSRRQRLWVACKPALGFFGGLALAGGGGVLASQFFGGPRGPFPL